LLIKVHARILHEDIVPVTPFNDLDFKLSLSAFFSTMAAPSSVLCDLIIGGVYNHKISDSSTSLHILQIWDEELESFTALFETSRMVALAHLEQFFYESEDQIFQFNPDINRDIETEIHMEEVCRIGNVLCQLMLPASTKQTRPKLTSNAIILSLENLAAGSSNLRILMETREKSLFNLFLRQEAGNLKQFANSTSDFLKRLLMGGESNWSMQKVDTLFQETVLNTLPYSSRMGLNTWIQLLLSTNSIVMESYQSPKTIDTRFVVSLPALFSSLFGFLGEYDANVYNVVFRGSDHEKQDIKVPSLTGFSLKGAVIEDDTISQAQEKNSQVLSQLYLLPVKTDSSMSDLNDTMVKFDLEDEVLGGNKIGQMVFKSRISSSILNKNSISVTARDIGSFKTVQDIKSSELTVKRINWPWLETDFLKDQDAIHIQILFYTTEDCENERAFIFNQMLPSLSAMLKIRYPLLILHFVDMQQATSDSICQEKNFTASLNAIDQSDLVFFIVGSRMGPYHRTSYEFERVLKRASQKASTFFFRSKISLNTLPSSFKKYYEPECADAGRKMDKIIAELSGTLRFNEYLGRFSYIENDRAKMSDLDEFSSLVQTKLLDSIMHARKSSMIVAKSKQETSMSLLSPTTRSFTLKLHGMCQDGRENTSLIVTGQLGSGKRTILNQLSRLFSDEWIILKHISCGAKFNLPSLITRFSQELNSNLHPNQSFTVPFGMMALEKVFLDLLSSALDSDKKVAIIINDLDSAEDIARTSSWLANMQQRQPRGKIVWVFSCASKSILHEYQSQYHDLQTIEIPLMATDDFEEKAKNASHLLGLDVEMLTEKFQSHAKNKPILYANLMIKKLTKLRETGFLLQFDQVHESIDILMMSCLDDLKSNPATWNKALECFLAICTSREGLREFEITSLLNISSIDWAKLKDEIRDFMLLTDEGFYVMYHPSFRDLIKSKYLLEPKKALESKKAWNQLARAVNTVKSMDRFWHLKLSDYFNSPKSTLYPMDSRRVVDAAYHLLQAGANSAKLCSVIGRIHFLESAVTSNLHQEVPGLLSNALAVSRKENDAESSKTIKECISFWQTYSKVLLQSPKLAVSLALNMPAGFAPQVNSSSI
jgi:hypothetical protein